MGSHQSVEMPLHTMSLAPFNAAIGPIVDLVTVLPPPNQIPPRELPHGCNLDERPPRFTYDPITYFKTATATFTLILDHTTLIPHADGSTETTIAPFKTTIEQPYTETLTKPTDGPSQPSSPSVGKEGVVKERRRGEAPITEVVVVTEWTTVTALDTVTVHLVPSPTLVTQEVTATVYPIPAPLTTERNPPVPRDEHHLAAAAAAAVLEEGTKIAFGVQRHTPHTPDCAAPSITCTVTIISTTSIPEYPPFTSFPTSTPSTTISVTSSAAPPSTSTTSASAIPSSSTISSSLATTTTTFASASSSSSSAATITTPSATPTPSISNAGAVGGGGKGGAALAATMAVLWGLLASVGVGLVG
ncbi:hypothetical protein IWX49DRAFT_641431 [Phyllosticta citricarpa]|uniref:Uncharacterized protein n=1 Tax=Phyllosticta paracitricarpa TaxID=2016321 RepID=A0ABR1MT20_9PEZI